MQFITALLEHFVVGIVSLIWGLPLLYSLDLIPNADLEKHKEILIAVSLPIAYVVGIFVDVFASILVTWIRCALMKLTPKYMKSIVRYLVSGGRTIPYGKTVKILKRSPDEAVKFLLLLTSREKTCRGVFLCLLLAALININVKSQFYVSPLVLSILAIIAFLVSLRLTDLTQVFKEQLSKDSNN